MTVNRGGQYNHVSIEDDRANLNDLLDWWTQPYYDYYNEWLMETYEGMKKAGIIEEEEHSVP